MSGQTGIFDAAAGEAAKENGIKQAGDNANAEWMAAALEAIELQAGTGLTFTTDDIWAAVDYLPNPTEGRAMGAAMVTMAKRGVIVPLDRYVKSERPECHRRPVRVWMRKPR